MTKDTAEMNVRTMTGGIAIETAGMMPRDRVTPNDLSVVTANDLCLSGEI